jgi:tetratricopeptide (TPR) repeat protein
VGDVLRAQGRLDDALKNYRDSLAIFQRMVVSDPSNTDWQSGLSLSYGTIGDVLGAQGKLDDALKSYRDALAIRQRLAVSDPSNTDWQSSLSQSYGAMGEVLRGQGKLDEALKNYRDSLAIFQRLAASDQNNTNWQTGLAIASFKIGEVLKAQGGLDDALKSYRDSLAIFQRLAASDINDMEWQQDSIENMGTLAYDLILAGDFTRALEASDLVISIAPDQIWLYTNRAHALMFLARVDEARVLYLQYRGEKLMEDKSWDTAVLEDFAQLRKAGLTHPLMDEIEKRFAAGG